MDYSGDTRFSSRILPRHDTAKSFNHDIGGLTRNQISVWHVNSIVDKLVKRDPCLRSTTKHDDVIFL